MLPFTREQFLGVFASYNQAIWPGQVVAYMVAVGMVAALLRPSPVSGRMIAGALAGMWIWTGAVYHWLFFSRINQAAFVFGLLFVLEGVLLAYAAVVRNQLRFRFSTGIAGAAGISLTAYAAVIYPLVGRLAGHAYPAVPVFGVTPCPVTIFTFGLLLLSIGRLPLWLLIVPFIWSLIGGSAAILLGVPQDWLLLFSGLITVPLLALHNRPETPAEAG